MNRRLIYVIALALQGSGGIPITISPSSAEGLSTPEMLSMPNDIFKELGRNTLNIDRVEVDPPQYQSRVSNRIPTFNKIARRPASDLYSGSGDNPYNDCLFIDPPKLLGSCTPDLNSANNVNLDGDPAIVYIGPDLLLGQI